MGEYNQTDKYTALYCYCTEYYKSQTDWRYALQCKLEKRLKPGPTFKDVLSLNSFVVNEYYNHLLTLFESNYKPITNYKVIDGDLQFESKYWSISTELYGDFDSSEDLAREVWGGLQGRIMDFYPSLVDVYRCIEELGLEYPISIPTHDTDGDEIYGLTFCFDF